VHAHCAKHGLIAGITDGYPEAAAHAKRSQTEADEEERQQGGIEQDDVHGSRDA
jgi:Na+/glutamate symporter